jgi:putative SOS response-associated peptidase YedK
MCGRYYSEIDDKEIGEIIEAVKGSDGSGTLTLKTSGEVFPGDVAPVIVASRQYRAMKWGFTSFDGKAIINARSETALDKPMFRTSILERRCLIPANSYFEWQKNDSRKTKYEFRLPNGGTLLLAGCWRSEPGGTRFVILTRDAVNGCETIHDRMPVIIPREFADDWFERGGLELSVTELKFEEYGNARLFD